MMFVLRFRSLLLAALLFLHVYSGLTYECNDGTTIDDENECDFREDCSEGEDEASCPGTCDYESDLCQWWQETEEDTFDWTLWAGSGPDDFNGPGADHTLNSVNGHYYYVDDTETAKGDTAILRSPKWNQAARGCKFTFWYYIFGEDMGTLKVFQYTPSDDRYYNLMRAPDITDDPSLAEKWLLYEVEVAACAQNFKLSIEAKASMNNDNTGGYAIDDMRFVDCAYTFPLAPGGTCETDKEMCDSGHCYPAEEKCDLTLNCCDGTDELLANCVDYHQCDFESGWCEWEQLTDDERDWTRQQGSTGTGNTGPARDHTTASGNGYYIYTEANDALPGDTYRIGSFYVQGNPTGCKMRFYHHQQGMGIGTLSVLTRTQINGPMTRWWLTVDPHGDYWLYESIDFDIEDDFQVIIEGIRGDSNIGDIAVDDISFTPGCVKSNDPLPNADATPTPGVTCPSGQRPCDDETCIDESKYCDFYIDCAKLGDDEAYCPAVCDFDLGFCYWSQDVNDDFDWSWFDAPTMPSDYKGPGTDHTLNSNLGHYIYVDGSTSRLNTKAKFISPIYRSSARGCTFSMFYYMFGLEYGDLEVRLLTLDDGQDIFLKKVSDDILDYNKWIEQTVTIPACIGRFQVVIDAEDRQRIPSEGGFAVDDVKFTGCAFERPDESGSCGINSAQCNTGECFPGDHLCDLTVDCCDGSDETRVDCTSFGYTLCDFEEGLCGWSQMTTDEFDWRRHQGRTGSENTGPEIDHTTGTSSGYYIYTEVSDRRRGDRAKLVSVPLEATTIASSCGLRFYYHMVGSGIGELGVYTRTAINGPMTLEWSRDQPDEDEWVFKTLDIRSNEDFEIIFMGTAGITAYGDISLDDISLTPGCSPRGSSLPVVTTPPPSQIPCQSGTLPCNNGCIDESRYCDFIHDCMPDEQDEELCPVFCDFEDEHLCYWTHDDANDFDWTLLEPHEGVEPGFRGPETDHTTFTAAGHYIFVDGTTSERDQRARLVSPVFKKARRGCIFSMWYYMFGAEYGDLEVRLLTADSDVKLTKAEDDVNDYNKWIRHQAEIPPCTTNFQIVIDAEDRQLIPNTEGGFAVDDMLFQDCAYPAPVTDGACGVTEAQCETGECYPAAQTCDFTSDCCDGSDELLSMCTNLGYSLCDFESGMCENDWEQLTTDEFDWTRENGTTGSEGTGPSNDHTTGSGFYIYTEASNPMREGERAQLASYPISRTVAGQCEVRFFYHMKGTGIGTLNVYTRTAINGPLSLIWSEDRQVGGDWTYKSLDISSLQDFQIILEGVIGYTVEGDIGIDDISLTPQCERSANSLPIVSTPKQTTQAPRTLPSCLPGRFLCTSTQVCIVGSRRCDGIQDCVGGEDEQGCSTPPVDVTSPTCDPGWYQCPTSKACIDNGQVCDGVDDCSLGEDEEDCYKPKNKPLIIGLSVTFGTLAIVCAAALAFYIVNRQRSLKKAGAVSFSSGMSNPGYENEMKNAVKIGGGDVAFNLDRSDA